MIRRLRLKIIMLILLLSAVLLSIAAGAFYSATAVGLRRDSESLLMRVIGEPPLITPFERNSTEVQLPYFVVTTDSSGKVTMTEGGYFTLTSRQQLQDIVTACLGQSSALDQLEDSNLRYYRTSTENGWRIAFVDITLEQSTLQTLSRNLLLLCSGGLLLIFLLALLASRLSVRPIAKAMALQQQFLSDASHELKTPLTVILSNSELLLCQHASLDRKQRWLQNIQYEAQQMQSLVLDLLELGHTESGLPRQSFTPIDLSELAETCALSFDSLAYEAQHTIHFHAEPALWVQGNSQQLWRLLSILLDNAIKYATPKTAIQFSLCHRRRLAVVTVSNLGPSIPSEQLSHLFDRFYRIDSSRNGSESFGLGLSIAKSIAAQHRGTIQAQSHDGTICFTIELPLTKRR